MGALAIAVMAGAPPGGASESTVAATIESYQFSPEPISVEAGAAVTWTNRDSVKHTVISAGGVPFASPELAKGESWTFTFEQAGSIAYYCTLHPEMVGTVKVAALPIAPTVDAVAPVVRTVVVESRSRVHPLLFLAAVVAAVVVACLVGLAERTSPSPPGPVEART